MGLLKGSLHCLGCTRVVGIHAILYIFNQYATNSTAGFCAQGWRQAFQPKRQSAQRGALNELSFNYQSSLQQMSNLKGRCIVHAGW